MGNEPFQGPTLSDVVEVDETLVGAKDKVQRPRLLGAIKPAFAGATTRWRESSY